MNNNQYIYKILSLCTDEQKSLFSRMYPDGPNKAQVSWAIKQIETTLRDSNERAKKAQNNLKLSELELFEIKGKLSTLTKENKDMRDLISELQCKIKNLSTPERTNRAEIEEKLDKLHKLECGGVDNWEFYDEAMTQGE
jgi:septal ring factor EnvC (AmiA/AmiB activator)